MAPVFDSSAFQETQKTENAKEGPDGQNDFSWFEVGFQRSSILQKFLEFVRLEVDLVYFMLRNIHYISFYTFA